MKLAFVIFVFALYLPLQLHAQHDDALLVKNTKEGMYINLSNPEWISTTFDLYRKAGNESTFKKIATLGKLNSQADLEKRIDAAQKIFTSSKSPKAQGVEAAWHAYLKDNDTLRAFIVSVPQLSFVFNTAYQDRDVRKGVAYQYQIKENQKIIATSKPLVFTERFPFPDLSNIADSARGTRIQFTVPYPEEFAQFITIEAKRKLFTAKQTDFTRVTLAVSTQKKNNQTYLVLTDTSLHGFSEYNYQLRLQTIFGENDSAGYTLSATNIPRSMMSAVAEVKVKPSKVSRAFNISWKLRDPQLVQSLALYRSENFDGNYALIGHFNPKDTATTDPIKTANELYFYYLELTDLFGNKRKSIKIHSVYDGKHQPTPPIDFSAAPSQHGVSLTWKASDPFTRGFYVFRRQGIIGDFSQVSPFVSIQNNSGSFTDSTRLDPNYTFYYTVKAESDTYDKSIFSDTVSFRQQSSEANLKPPSDVSAVFRSNKIFITWQNMNALVPATAGYLLFRKKVTDKDYALLKKEPLFTQNYFIDSTLLSAVQYQYAIASIDGSGNQSLKSIPVTIDLTNKFIIIPEKLGYERLSTAIKLKWTSIDTKRIENIKIYRATEDEPFKLLSSVVKESQSYVDNAVVRGKLYSYRLVITDAEGTPSTPTEALLVSF
jgi:hypothetical protein